jgi:hypothetical protein
MKIANHIRLFLCHDRRFEFKDGTSVVTIAADIILKNPKANRQDSRQRTPSAIGDENGADQGLRTKLAKNHHIDVLLLFVIKTVEHKNESMDRVNSEFHFSDLALFI